MISEFIVESIDEIVDDGRVNSEGNLEAMNVPVEKLLFRQTLTLLSSTEYILVTPVFEELIDVHFGIAYFAKLIPEQGILTYRECMRDSTGNLAELARWSIEYLQFCAYAFDDDAIHDDIICQNIAATMNNIGFCFLKNVSTQRELFHRGIKYLHRSLSLDPTQIYPHHNIGDMYAQVGEDDLALKHYALEKNPHLR